LSLKHTIKDRLASEQGYTSLEFRVVMGLFLILMMLAVPAYLSFGSQASIAAVEVNIRSAVPAAETYFNDTDPTTGGDGSYAGLTGAKLRGESPGVDASIRAGVIDDKYCLQDVDQRGSVWSYEGGNGGASRMVNAACAAEYRVA
jgi:type II secretory pathway pseudopilin PulG